MAEPAGQGRGVVGGGGPGDVAIGPDQHGAEAGELGVISGELRGHGIQAVGVGVRAVGVGVRDGGGGAQVEQDEPRWGQEAEQGGGAAAAQVEVGSSLAD